MIKIIFWPLTPQELCLHAEDEKGPAQIAQIREKYKDDREKLNKELMAVYRTYKVNPMGGCLPMVLQIPVSLPFTGCSTPPWTSAPAFHALGQRPHRSRPPEHRDPHPVPGRDPGYDSADGDHHVPPAEDDPDGRGPASGKDHAHDAVMFTFFFLNFPAGLVLYWLVNNVLSIAQQYWINRARR